MTEASSWPERLSAMAAIREEMARHDVDGIWRYHLPALGASESRLSMVEERLGRNLDLMQRSFLSIADDSTSYSS
jgi:hypothetical protein